ncbi:hypothetical protein [Heliophilum fasciatum]|uniref:Uncharacterized protein n=1 Tax=Heliophilum fasciatum TaxID=35700 RepID=A0A4R2RGN5_9FIRM|nr:hypothetical protein [Heliophilum fasciatum]MCW2279115.1 hypothetical protein [Heliophilum fasciatum]TCP61257.1 hypothetical protein EDD73_12910 [Heliophilum fasciatum]
MFGVAELILGYLQRNVGMRTDGLDASGSIHSRLRATTFGGLFYLNDGADGDRTFATNTVLESGVYRYNNMTVNTGVTITPTQSFLAFFVKGTLNLTGTATISASGKGAAGGLGGYCNTANSGTAGNPGVAGFGGAGSGASGGGRSATYMSGAGGDTDYPGGTAAAAANGNTGVGLPKGGRLWSDLQYLMACKGGGGGGGASVTSSTSASWVRGGAGGAGGGAILIVANNITGTGMLKSEGVAGSIGTQSDTNYGVASGGGGGGGGYIVVFGTLPSTITTSVVGGTGGPPATTTYYSGAAGGNGCFVNFPLT